jgi:predicted secreted hydrolase
VAAGRHAAVERFSRGAGGLAGASGAPFAVWLEDWRADSLNADGSAVRLVARDAASGLSLHLELRATKPLVAHGDRGLSPKSGAGQRVVPRGLHANGGGGRIGTAK